MKRNREGLLLRLEVSREMYIYICIYTNNTTTQREREKPKRLFAMEPRELTATT